MALTTVAESLLANFTSIVNRLCRSTRVAMFVSTRRVMVNVPDVVLEYPYAPQPAGPAGTEAMNGPPA